MKIIPCFYNQSNPLGEALGNLKIEYAMTESTLIKELLELTESLIIFRDGSICDLRERMISESAATEEEEVFIHKLEKHLN